MPSRLRRLRTVDSLAPMARATPDSVSWRRQRRMAPSRPPSDQRRSGGHPLNGSGGLGRSGPVRGGGAMDDLCAEIGIDALLVEFNPTEDSIAEGTEETPYVTGLVVMVNDE